MHQDKDDAEIPGYNQAVTAADFVFAFRRVVDPAIQSPYATSFYCIQNAQQIHQGSAPVDQLGVTAVNDTTLVIQLAYPNALFLELMSSTAAMPCHEAFFKQTNGRYGLSMSTVLSNGRCV